MKKKTFLKSLSFTSLALLMGAAGVFAFAPLGAGAQGGALASASEMVDQINTKANGKNIKYAPSPLGLDPENDPVIYTTESGLEIKFGGESVSDQLASGKPLSGYPYFTMGTYNGYAVNWVIIGRNTNDTVFTSAISAHLYSTWKTNNNVSYSGLKPLAKYWFNGGGYETTTPAGSAINGVVPSKSYVADVTKATKTVVGNAEVPQGCVLAITESLLGTTQFNTGGSNSNYNGSAISTYLQNLYSSTLGLTSAQKNSIVKQDGLISHYLTGTATPYTSTYSTTDNQYFFPLAHKSNTSLPTQQYYIQTYLTTNALRVACPIGTTSANIYWTRSNFMNHPADLCVVTASGELSYKTSTGATDSAGNIDANSSMYARPACVIKLA